jgi:hypothetical protein
MSIDWARIGRERLMCRVLTTLARTNARSHGSALLEGDGVARSRATSTLASPPAQLDSAKSFAQQTLDGRTGERRFGTQLGQHGLHLALAKAEVTQRREALGVGIDAWSRDRRPCHPRAGR